MVKPPTLIDEGAAAGRCQVGAAAVPVPGHWWQLLQSCRVGPNALWFSGP